MNRFFPEKWLKKVCNLRRRKEAVILIFESMDYLNIRKIVYISLFFLFSFFSYAKAGDFETFSSTFLSGTPSGNIDITYENCQMSQESQGAWHILMDRPGQSTIKGSFFLNNVPEKLYIQINHRTSTLHELCNSPTYEIFVNGQKSNNMELYFDIYTVMGYEITPFCRKGMNEFTITLLSTAMTNLWVRQIDVSPVVSFVEQYKQTKKSGGLYLLIPLYIAYFFLIAITISYLLFVIMWRNSFDPQLATILALFICGIGFTILPFLIMGLHPYSVLASIFGLLIGIIWILRMHR